jgi:hypothetical protein
MAAAKLAQVRTGEQLEAVENEADWLTHAWKFASGTSVMWRQGHFRLCYRVVKGETRLRSLCVRCGAHFAKQSGTSNELKHLARNHPDVKVGLQPVQNVSESLSGMSEKVRR